jgi:hypothetical protein
LIQWGRFAKSAKADQGKVIVIQQFKIYLDENPKRPLAPLPLDLTVAHIISGTRYDSYKRDEKLI